MERVIRVVITFAVAFLAIAVWRERDPTTVDRLSHYSAQFAETCTVQFAAAVRSKASQVFDQVGVGEAKAQAADPLTEFNPPAPSVQPGIPSSPVPSVPTAPVSATRPDNWVGGPSANVAPPASPQAMDAYHAATTASIAGQSYPASAPGYPTSAASAQAPSAAAPFAVQQTAAATEPVDRMPWEATKIIAVVDGQWVLAGEVTGPVNMQMKAVKKHAETEIPPEIWESEPEFVESQLRMARDMAIKTHLRSLIDNKILVADAKRTIPDANFKTIQQKMVEQFDKEELPKAMKGANVASEEELEIRLREVGSSVDRERRAFAERTIARQWLRQSVKVSDEVSHDELLKHYRAHLDEYEIKAAVRYEQVMVRIENFPSRDYAWQTIAALGNQIMQGAPIAEVANFAVQYGQAPGSAVRDWTEQGALSSEQVDVALFQLPVGALSPIIEDARAMYIVRVVERREQGHVSFRDAQSEITEHIRQDRIMTATQAYLDKLKDKAKVWTIFDGATDDAPIVASPATPPLR